MPKIVLIPKNSFRCQKSWNYFLFKIFRINAENCFGQKLFSGLETIFGNNSWAPSEGAQMDPKITKTPYKTCRKWWFLVKKGPWRVLDQIRVRALRSNSQKLFWFPKIVSDSRNPKTIFISKAENLILIIVFEKQFVETIFFSKGGQVVDWLQNFISKHTVLPAKARR